MKKLRSYLSVLLALVMACSVFAALAIAPATTASAATKAVDLSATRYRYPICRFENPKFTKGVAVDKCQATSAYLLTDAATQNGDSSNDLFFARVEEYDMFNMSLGKNKALVVTANAGTNPAVAEKYAGYQFHFGEVVGTREDIFPESISGVSGTATDHGIMFHIEFKGIAGHEEDGYRYQNLDEQGNGTGEYSTHVGRDINCTFQEWDYKENGKVNKKAGKVVTTAMNVKAGAHITLIWTKDVSWTNPDPEKYTQQARETNGMPIKTEDGNYEYEAIPNYSHKAGDVQVWETYSYEYNGSSKTGGTINLPRDFCGYVIIPFSEMHLCWDSANSDGMLNFKKMELCNLYWGTYWYHEGETIIDEYCFWGPTFAKVNGAYDYGNITFANHKDSLVNRKEIKIAEEVKSEEPSKEAPKVIETAVTLENKATGIKLEAPTTAKIDKSVTLSADVVDPDESDYTKQLYAKNFGEDRTQFAAYTIYLGADGDQEPEDFCQIDFPIPDGFAPDKCTVYTFDDDNNKVLVESTLAEDKKSISIKTQALGTFIIYQGGEIGDTSAESEESAEVESKSEASTEKSEETKTESGSLTWLWIVIGAVVVIGAGLAVFFIVKGKKQGEGEETEDEEKIEE